MSDLFEKATKNALRFGSARGQIATEDLWALNLKELDSIAKDLHKSLQDTEISFIDTPTEQNSLMKLKLDVVKRVIEVRLEEKSEMVLRKEKAAHKKFLQELLHEKKTESLKSMSVEEIEKELAQL